MQGFSRLFRIKRDVETGSFHILVYSLLFFFHDLREVRPVLNLKGSYISNGRLKPRYFLQLIDSGKQIRHIIFVSQIKSDSKHENLKGYEETTLAEEYSAKFILDRNDESHEWVVLDIDYLSVNPVWLRC